MANLVRPAVGAALFVAGLLLGLALGSGPGNPVPGEVVPPPAEEAGMPGDRGAPPIPNSIPNPNANPNANPNSAPPALDPPSPPPDASASPPPSPPAAVAAPGPLAGRTEPLPPYVLPERIGGRLVDARTGRPIPGGRVSLVWATSDGTLGGSIGAELDENGSFTFEAIEEMKGMAGELFRGGSARGEFASAEDLFADFEYALRFSAKGFATVDRGEPGASTEVALEPEARDPLTGTVRVEARWNDGSRFAGRLVVDLWPEEGAAFSQWVLPDHDGTFPVVGVPAGVWNVRVSGRKDSGARVAIPEAGEVRVSLPVHRRGVIEPEGAPAGAPREVEVLTGPRDPGPGAFVRAEARPGLFFRSEVVASSARFPALPAGRWEFVLQVPDRAEARFAADVPPGSGRLALTFPAEPAGPR